MVSRQLTKMEGEEYIVGLALGYQVSQVLFAALDLDIFTVLGRGGKTINELARSIRCNPKSLERFTNVLIALNLLEKSSDRLSNTHLASHYLVKGSSRYLGNAIHHNSNLWDFWKRLDTRVIRGENRAPGRIHLRHYPHRLKDFLAAMGDFAALKAHAIADALSIERYKKMLDVGSGPGTYAIAFASRNPALHCTLVDLETALAYTKKLIRKSGYHERISTYSCQIIEEGFPEDRYDLILISNLIHLYSDAELRKIIEKVRKVAATPATIVIHDYIVDEVGWGPLYASLFDLTMLVGTPQGRCYTTREVETILKQIGAKNIRQVPISLGSSLVIGEKNT